MKGSFPRAFLAFLLATPPPPARRAGVLGARRREHPAGGDREVRAPAARPAVSRRIQSMLDVRAPGIGIVAPDGARLYFRWRITGTAQVWRLNAPKGFPVQLTGGEDATSIVAVTPDGKWLVLSRDVGGEENPGLYLQSAEGGPLKTIQNTPKVQTLFEFVTHDGKERLFPRERRRRRTPTRSTATTSRAGAKSSSSASRASGTSPIIAATGRGLAPPRQGDRLVLGRVLRVRARRRRSSRRSSGGRERRSTTPRTARRRARCSCSRTRSATSGACTRGDGRRATAMSFPEVLAPEGMDVAGFAIDQARAARLHVGKRGRLPRLHVARRGDYGPARCQLPDADQVYAGDATPRRALRDHRRRDRAGTRARATCSTGRRGSSRSGSCRGARRSTSRRSRARGSRGTRRGTARGSRCSCAARRGARGENAADPCPVVVSSTAGPKAQATPGFSPCAQMFVDAGFVYVEPNVRGSDGYGKTWSHADDGPKRLAVITDIEDAAKWIREQLGRERQGARRSASTAAATAATRCSWP